MIAVTANLTSVLFTPVRDFKCVLSSLETSRADLSWPTHSTWPHAARSRSHRLNGRGAAGARAGYSATKSFAKAALLVEHEQWRNCSIPAYASNRSTRCLHCVARLSRIATCVSWQFEAFDTRTSVGDIYMFMGDKQRT